MKAIKQRIFVGGLDINTTDAALEQHFSQFGVLDGVEIIIERKTGISKGYGFITCSDQKIYNRILSQQHSIDGVIVDCNSAYEKNHNQDTHSSFLRRIFLGGINDSITNDDLNEYFSQFGQVMSAYGLKNAATNKNKGFGFVEYSTVQESQRVLSIKNHFIGEFRISCSPYINKREVKINQNMNSSESGDANSSKRGSKGYARGGYNNSNHSQNSKNFDSNQSDYQNDTSQNHNKNPNWNQRNDFLNQLNVNQDTKTNNNFMGTSQFQNNIPPNFGNQEEMYFYSQHETRVHRQQEYRAPIGGQNPVQKAPNNDRNQRLEFDYPAKNQAQFNPYQNQNPVQHQIVNHRAPPIHNQGNFNPVPQVRNNQQQNHQNQQPVYPGGTQDMQKMDYDEDEYREFKEFQKWKQLRNKVGDNQNQCEADQYSQYNNMGYQGDTKSYTNSDSTHFLSTKDKKSNQNSVQNQNFKGDSYPGKKGHFENQGAYGEPNSHKQFKNMPQEHQNYQGYQNFGYLNEKMPKFPKANQNMPQTTHQMINQYQNHPGYHQQNMPMRTPYQQQHQAPYMGQYNYQGQIGLSHNSNNPHLFQQGHQAQNLNMSQNFSQNNTSSSGNETLNTNQTNQTHNSPNESSGENKTPTPPDQTGNISQCQSQSQHDPFHYDFSNNSVQGQWRTHSVTNRPSNSNSLENNVSGESKENSASNSDENNQQKDYKYGPNTSNGGNPNCGSKKEERKTNSSPYDQQGSSDNSGSYESKDQRNSDQTAVTHLEQTIIAQQFLKRRQREAIKLSRGQVQPQQLSCQAIVQLRRSKKSSQFSRNPVTPWLKNNSTTPFLSKQPVKINLWMRIY